MSTWENRYTFEISSADPDSATPVWVDFTTRVRDVEQVMEAARGRQNDLDQTEPGEFAVQLENADDAVTYGNTSSPYAAWWGPARKCRLRETIAGTVLDVYTGYIQVPTETIRIAGVDQRVTLTCVDRLGRLDSGEPFASTLAAHIRGSVRNNALKAYWPLVDAAPPYANLVGRAPALPFITPGATTPVTQVPAVQSNAGTAIPADDAAPVLLVPGVNGVATVGGGPFVDAELSPFGEAPAVTAGQVVTAILWANLDLTYDDLITILEIATNDGVIDLRRQASGSGGTFRLTKPVGTLTGAVNSDITVGAGVYYILAIRYGYTPNLLEMWVNDKVYTATLSGVISSDLIAAVAAAPYGSAAHMQLYVGDAADFTYADFLAQRQVGLTGLERQATGDRIRTVAQYAGIPATELTQIDTGASVMQRASLAGQTPLQAMRDAERTEQGLLYVDGSGNLVFKDRRTLYNI